MGDTAGDPAAYGRAGYEACSAGDGTLGRCAGPEPRVNARDCGDGPFECRSGYVFGRASTRASTSPPTRRRGRIRTRRTRSSTRPCPAPRRRRARRYSTDHRRDRRARRRRTSSRRRTAAAAGRVSRVEPAAEGAPVLQRHRRVRRAAARRLPRHPQRHRDRAARHGWRLPDGAVLEPVGRRRRRLDAHEPGRRDVLLALDRTAARPGRTRRCRASATRSTTSSSATATSRSSGTTTTSPPSASNVLMAWPSGQDVVAGTDPRYTDGNGTDGFDVLQCRSVRERRLGRRHLPGRGRPRPEHLRVRRRP